MHDKIDNLKGMQREDICVVSYFKKLIMLCLDSLSWNLAGHVS